MAITEEIAIIMFCDLDFLNNIWIVVIFKDLNKLSLLQIAIIKSKMH